jgi:tetratricopeptide (TPR) repeat protein/energy-coupling factor transporter ATP-binding protein EcfA2
VSASDRLNPFPGLRPFDATEAHLFFGREGQSDELLRRLRLHRFVAVVGSSGSGKSSLVRAGLLPSLEGGLMVSAGSEWRIATLRPGNDPIGCLAQTLNAPEVLGRGPDGDPLDVAFTEAVLRRGALGLIETVAEARLAPTENVLVVVDQFEELFRLRRAPDAGRTVEDDAAAFVKLLLEATRQRELPIYVVITMRSDYLGDCAQYRDLPEAINEGQYLIPRLTRDERRQAIVSPVAVGGAEITPRLVNRLLNEAGDNPDQLPILQHALMRTWDYWAAAHSGHAPIDIADYDAIGGMAEALSRHADEAFAELPDARTRMIAEKVFRRLTEKGSDNREIRRPTAVSELCAVSEASQADMVAVIDVFRRAGRSFLTPAFPVPLHAGSVIDISHESLIRGWVRLRAWVEDEAESAKVYRRLSDTARLHARGRAGLWRDPDLQLASDWWERDQPNESWASAYDPDFTAAAAFLSESRAARDATVAAVAGQRRRRRHLALGAIGVLSALLAASTYEWHSARQSEIEARAQETEAVRQRLTAGRMQEIADSVKAGLAMEQDSLARANGRLLEQTRNLRHEALHVREAERENNSNIIALVARMLPEAAPLGATFLHHANAVARANSGQYDSAAVEETRALEADSEFLAPHINRSDIYLNAGKPRLAVADAEFVLRRSPHNELAHLNRAVGLAMLERYDDALAAFDQAIAGMRYTIDGGSQNHLSPDIQRATLLRSISLSGPEMGTALYYGRANVLAFAGRDGFVEALARADSQRPRSSDIVLNALNWNWMQRVATPRDYGASAAEGALWERAGFETEALRAYDAFRREDARRADSRYVSLRRFVADRWHALNPGDAAVPPVRADAPDVETLVLESEEAADRGASQEAEAALTSALALEPRNVDLLLRRAGIRLAIAQADPLLRAHYYELVTADCDRALALVPTLSRAYSYRARVNYERSGSDSALRANPALQHTILADLDRALQSDSSNQIALINHGWALIPTDTAAGVVAFERATQTLLPGESGVYYNIARMDNALGQHDRARAAINRAIEIKSDSDWYYVARALAQRGLRYSEPEVWRGFAEGMVTVANARRKRGDRRGADSADAHAWDAQMTRIVSLLKDARGPDSVSVRHQLADATSHMTAAALEFRGSADSVRVWYGRLAVDPKFPAGATEEAHTRVVDILNDEMRYLRAFH